MSASPDRFHLVRLTAKQRLVLMDIANEGSKERIDEAPRIVLLHLGLIVRRIRYTPKERQARAKTRDKLAREVVALLHAKRFKEASRKANDLDNHVYHDDDKAWFLTAAAQRYLKTGTVTIKRGKAAPSPFGGPFGGELSERQA